MSNRNKVADLIMMTGRAGKQSVAIHASAPEECANEVGPVLKQLSEAAPALRKLIALWDAATEWGTQRKKDLVAGNELMTPEHELLCALFDLEQDQ